MKWKYLYINPRRIKTHPINMEKAYRYAKMMEKGAKFPPVKVYLNDKGVIICQNGAHRTMAAIMTGMNVFVKTKAEL
jgi:hypothetical protein